MIKVRRLGHASLETPDLERAIDYHTQINGLVLVARDHGHAFLATKTGLLAIRLELGRVARCTRLSFELAPDVDVAQIKKQLESEGLVCSELQGACPGISRMISFSDPKGTVIELFSEWSYLENRDVTSGIGPMKLGHVAFFVPDPAAMAHFYERVLGFRISDWIDDFFVFLRCNPDHHSVNFIKGDAPRMHHIAFELRDVSQTVEACDLLAQNGIPLLWGPLRLGPGHNIAIFHSGHDGHVVEMYTELDQMKDEELGYFDPRPWHRDKPQRPKIWKQTDGPTWGALPPPGFASR